MQHCLCLRTRDADHAASLSFFANADISTCKSCGLPKRSHHFCPNCYSTITRRWKSDLRSALDFGAAESKAAKARQDGSVVLGEASDAGAAQPAQKRWWQVFS